MSNVVFLAERGDNTKSEFTETLNCGNCSNKTYILTYEGGEAFPRITCASCRTKIGNFGWINEE